MSEIRDPSAYENAKSHYIKVNASKTRYKKFLAMLEHDTPEFKGWILGAEMYVPELGEILERMRGEVAAEMQRLGRDENGDTWDIEVPTRAEYDAASAAWRKRVGYPPRALQEALREWGGLSEKQLAWARSAFAKNVERNTQRATERDAAEAARLATAQPWTAGRQEVTVTLQHTKRAEGTDHFGRATSTLKGMFLTADGRKLWCTVPWGLSTDTGTTYAMRVTVSPSRDDATMGFGKRPTLVKA